MTLKASPQEAAAAAKKILGCYPEIPASDPEQFAAALVENLSMYHPAVVARAADRRDGVVSKIKFLNIAAIRELLDTWAARGVRFFAPDVAFDEAEQYLPPLLARRGKPVADVAAALAWLRSVVEPVTPELYAAFESEARERIDRRDEDDWPVLATAMALACDIWTEDADFFGAGVAVWTTDRIEIFFRRQLKAAEPEEE